MVRRKKLVEVKKGFGVYRVKGCATDSYRCLKRDPETGKTVHCARAYFPVGTASPETCWKCGQETMVLETYRKDAKTDPERALKDKGEMCDCQGAKAQKAPKFADREGVTVVQGIHRKGQFGCIHHLDYGKTDQDLFEEDMGLQDDGYTTTTTGGDCPF